MAAIYKKCINFELAKTHPYNMHAHSSIHDHDQVGVPRFYTLHHFQHMLDI